jgi:hypothetical protein
MGATVNVIGEEAHKAVRARTHEDSGRAGPIFSDSKKMQRARVRLAGGRLSTPTTVVGFGQVVGWAEGSSSAEGKKATQHGSILFFLFYF